ncbi:hypothetical protein [Bradyrhizobium arachidis]|uniref:hypothetical protein n=1 Tax=Bradyrhizobium arachidis TaxID=858423 RepID=UPI0021622DA8|nr:hypothetical protein [Bradyrhizobium arachidis]UVO25330.1 hypothetical protein KUF59_22245 [Bradyrhizobium arachidis]
MMLGPVRHLLRPATQPAFKPGAQHGVPSARAAAPELAGIPRGWLPPGKKAAVVFTIDDVHPGTSRDSYEAGGDLGHGQLRFLLRLLATHSRLRATLFVTADWRAKLPSVSRPRIMNVPGLRRLWCEWNTLPAGTMRIDRFPRFVEFLKGLSGVEIGLHGLTDNRRRHPTHLEYLDASEADCRRSLAQIFEIFHGAGLPFVPGMSPPGWHVGPELATAMREAGLTFVGSSRDLVSPVHRGAISNMSGLTGTSLIEPQWVYGGLLNFTTNYQATSTIDRAKAIVDNGGLLAIKAHVIKKAGSHVALDGLDEEYCDHLHVLFDYLETVGADLWWTSMGEIAARCVAAQEAEVPAREANDP